MSTFNLSGSDNFFGVEESRTYYNVPYHKLQNTLDYMLEHFKGIRTIFIYSAKHKSYLGHYSRKNRQIVWIG